MRDSFGREIAYLRISVTDKCNLRCVYCMPAEGVPFVPHSQILRHEEIAEIVAEAATLGITKVRLTGGEPLVRRGIVDLVRMIADTPGIDLVAMTTNGTLLPRFAVPLKEAGLQRLNISLDTLDPDRYRHITRGGSLDAALAGVAAAEEAGFTGTKINMVVLNDTTEEEITAMQSFCTERDSSSSVSPNMTSTRRNATISEWNVPSPVGSAIAFAFSRTGRSSHASTRTSRYPSGGVRSASR
jgi:cyclic pyranopterin phosphate synthase